MPNMIIAAVSRNGVIGNNGKLPWNCPEDLQLFKRLTFGKTIIMGQPTKDSIGKELLYRKNVVVSRNKGYSLEDALLDNYPCQVIGGGEIYKACEEQIKKYNILSMVISHLPITVKGDTYFPEKLYDYFVPYSVGEVPSKLGLIKVVSYRRKHNAK